MFREIPGDEAIVDDILIHSATQKEPSLARDYHKLPGIGK